MSKQHKWLSEYISHYENATIKCNMCQVFVLFHKYYSENTCLDIDVYTICMFIFHGRQLDMSK